MAGRRLLSLHAAELVKTAIDQVSAVDCAEIVVCPPLLGHPTVRGLPVVQIC